MRLVRKSLWRLAATLLHGLGLLWRIVAKLLARGWNHLRDHPATAVIHLVLLAIALGLLLRITLPREAIVIQPMELTGSAAEKFGVTGKTVARLIIDEMRELAATGVGGGERIGIHGLSTPSLGIEIEGVSLARLRSEWERVRYMRHEISGDLLLNPESVVLRARTSPQSSSVGSLWETKKFPATTQGLQDAIDELALDVLSDLQRGLGAVVQYDYGRIGLLASLAASEDLAKAFSATDVSIQSLRDELSRDVRARTQNLVKELVGNIHMLWGDPNPDGPRRVLVKRHFVISYDTARKVPQWVAYHLTRENLQGSAERPAAFNPDPNLPVTERSENADYTGSGFDRGNLAPSGSFRRSSEARSEAHLLSNVAPQEPNLNRHMWARLEDEVRELATVHGSIWVFTGTLFLGDAEPRTIGANAIAVPTHFYKVILCQHSGGDIELFAFRMPNQSERLLGETRDYAVSVDDVEEWAGLDFFQAIEDPLETQLESHRQTGWPAFGTSSQTNAEQDEN